MFTSTFNQTQANIRRDLELAKRTPDEAIRTLYAQSLQKTLAANAAQTDLNEAEAAALLT